MMGRLVIANRGEIALRILRAARTRGHAAAVVSTPEDADALPRREADAVLEVPSFLDGDAIVAAARSWGADLLHPGYGYLSERPAFARAVEAAGIRFVGPTPEAMEALGGKESAKALARAAGIPVLEALGSEDLAALPPGAWAGALAARGVPLPWLVKASGGGGGRGMRAVASAEDLPDAVARASSEALAGFGDGRVFVEPLLAAPRHVEAQVFGDGRGGGVFLGERECSLQRRHQKVVEEAPAAHLAPALREAMGRAALALVAATAYRGAGTVEFLVEGDRFWFLEMNTRLQVEHPVTELVHGVDLVLAQLELAEGAWPAQLGDPGVFRVPEARGVALEARILAEDPRAGFLPTPGPLRVYEEPAGEGVRVDTGVAQGGRVNAAFDPMIAKLVVWGPDRPQAVARLARALADYTILGCTTNLPFLQAIARTEAFREGRTSTAWIPAHLDQLTAPLLPEPWRAFLGTPAFREALDAALQGAGAPVSAPAARFLAQAGVRDLTCGSPREQPAFRVEAGPGPDRFRLQGPAPARLGAPTGLPFRACRLPGGRMALALLGDTLTLDSPFVDPDTPGEAAAEAGEILAPMAGKILEVLAAEGEPVAKGQVLFVLESMKMQFEITAPAAGRLARVLVAPGQVLTAPAPLAVVD